MRHLISLLIVFILGAAIGGYLVYIYPIAQPIVQARQIREMGHYRLINPLLECDLAGGILDARKENFKLELSDKVNQLAAERNLVISVYYRDLNNGPTFGIRETEEFIPASLLKVPVMMAYYHESETNPDVLTQTLLLDKRAQIENASKQYIMPRKTLELGKYYSVNELIEQAIIYSDNDAIALLIDHVSESDLRDLYQLLGVSQTAITFPDGRLTVREYASFFRILFNASYLSRDDSEKALDLLTRVDFRDGLVAGVPADIPVAHKFGEAGTEDIHQIHDCGIIYAKNSPYLLCIMTRGGDIQVLTSTIAELSRYVYDKVHQ